MLVRKKTRRLRADDLGKIRQAIGKSVIAPQIVGTPADIADQLEVLFLERLAMVSWSRPRTCPSDSTLRGRRLPRIASVVDCSIGIPRHTRERIPGRVTFAVALIFPAWSRSQSRPSVQARLELTMPAATSLNRYAHPPSDGVCTAKARLNSTDATRKLWVGVFLNLDSQSGIVLFADTLFDESGRREIVRETTFPHVHHSPLEKSDVALSTITQRGSKLHVTRTSRVGRLSNVAGQPGPTKSAVPKAARTAAADLFITF